MGVRHWEKGFVAGVQPAGGIDTGRLLSMKGSLVGFMDEHGLCYKIKVEIGGLPLACRSALFGWLTLKWLPEYFLIKIFNNHELVSNI